MTKGRAVMGDKLAALVVLCLIALGEALPALAQQTPQPAAPQPLQGYYWPGPWHHMWGDGYGWSFWWMVPMMTLWILIIVLEPLYIRRSIIVFLMSAIAFPGLSPFGQVRVQFMIV